MYELPRAISARLQAAIRGARNADAVMKLAVFLARFHTAPGRLGRTFPVDRIALAAHVELDLTASQIRGALSALERIGLVERQAMPGSPYRRTAAGLRRRPVQWRIGAVFAVLFAAVNKAALARRAKMERRLVARNQTPARALLSGEQKFAGLDPKLAASLRELEAGVFKRGA